MDYYNEIDPFAAQWLRNLIKAGALPPGYVDERSILDVKPDDLAGYTQCHFFAGIGVWRYALRQAGWADDRPVWTGSCPCFPAGALVLTDKGYTPIEQVAVGDMVLTHKARWAPVTHVGSEEGELVEVKGQGHPGIVCTPDHPFLVGDDEWAAAKDLEGKRWRTVAQVPALPVPPLQTGKEVARDGDWYKASGWREGKSVNLGRFHTEGEARSVRDAAVATGSVTVRGADAVDTGSVAFARFLGYWVGDGWVSGSRVFICGARGDTDLLTNLMRCAGMAPCTTAERTSARASCGSRTLSAWLSTHFGATAAGKRLPAWLHGAPEEYRKAFLQGYWEADGHSEKGVRRWTTVSRALAIGVRVLLNQQGSPASITLHRPTAPPPD